MGGRGAASGMSVSGNKYGTEYQAIHRADNIKYLKRNDGKANLPMETMADDQNRVELGLASAITPFGHAVRAYNAERTICDLFRNRNSGDVHDLQAVVREYLRRKDKNIPLLLRYAKQFSLERIVQSYLVAIL